MSDRDQIREQILSLLMTMTESTDSVEESAALLTQAIPLVADATLALKTACEKATDRRVRQLALACTCLLALNALIEAGLPVDILRAIRGVNDAIQR